MCCYKWSPCCHCCRRWCVCHAVWFWTAGWKGIFDLCNGCYCAFHSNCTIVPGRDSFDIRDFVDSDFQNRVSSRLPVFGCHPLLWEFETQTPCAFPVYIFADSVLFDVYACCEFADIGKASELTHPTAIQLRFARFGRLRIVRLRCQKMDVLFGYLRHRIQVIAEWHLPAFVECKFYWHIGSDFWSEASKLAGYFPLFLHQLQRLKFQTAHHAHLAREFDHCCLGVLQESKVRLPEWTRWQMGQQEKMCRSTTQKHKKAVRNALLHPDTVSQRLPATALLGRDQYSLSIPGSTCAQENALVQAFAEAF